MLRKVTAPLMAAAVLASLAAPTALAQKKTITVYLREANSTEYQWEKEMIALFEKENPDIDVEVITEAGSDYASKLTTLWATGKPPDVWDHGGAVRTYQYNGWLLDLRKFVERDAKEIEAADFFPGAWASYRNGDKQWGMPFISIPSFLWYNVDRFEEAGVATPPVSWDDKSWTWDRFVEAARKLTARNGQGVLTKPGVSLVHWTYLDIAYSYLWGGDWFDEAAYKTGIPTKTTFNTPQNIQAYQRAKDLIFKERVAIATESNMGSAPEWFLRGDSAMIIGEGPWIVMGQTQNIKFRWGMAPMPRGTSLNTILYTDPWMISSQTKYPEEAWKFVKFITSKRVMESYLGHAIFPPSRRSVMAPYVQRLAKASGYHTPLQVLEALAGAQEYGRESLDHMIVGWPDYFNGPVAHLGNVWNPNLSVQQVLQQADQMAATIIRKYSR